MKPRYNISPTDEVFVIRRENHFTKLVIMKWGIVPSWEKKKSSVLINAKSETVATKPTFRSSFQNRRCLIPTDGFYEWKRGDKVKKPYLFRMLDSKPFAMAGLWDQNAVPDENLDTCTCLTTEANELVRIVHERMPAIIQPVDYAVWLNMEIKDPQILTRLLRPFPAEKMTVQEANIKVNKAGYDAPDCIEPVIQQGTLIFEP